MAVKPTDQGREGASDNGALPTFWPDALRHAARTILVKKGAMLFRRGDKTRGIYWVQQGQVRLQRYAPDGSEIVLHRARKGDYLAEASLWAQAYHCDALCTEAAELVLLPGPVLVACIREGPDFAIAWSVALSGNLRAVRACLERSGLRSARDRVLHYLVTEGGEEGAVTLNQPMTAWAAELGIAHETLYRTLADLERSGTIERARRIIRLA
jgi:CRP-like cAMP-binding protein